MTTTQTTQIEQARAVAEVAAAVRAAQDMPRDEERSRLRFLAACARPRFAERAFFRYDRGGKQTTGVTIGFALEAARCWGNMTSGSAELARYFDRSEMIAFAWDLETNAQRRITFVSPHVGYADSVKRGPDNEILPPRRLLVPRDVRESNQSTASRVEREAILAILPDWYVEEGRARCYKTINDENPGETIEDQRRRAIDMFEGVGVSLARVEARMGVPAAEWRAPDLAVLRVIVTEITRGEKTYDDEFPQPTPNGRPRSSIDIMNSGPADRTPPPDAAPDEDPPEPMATRRELNGIFARLGELGVAGRSDADKRRRRRLLGILLARLVENSDDIRQGEVPHLRTTLAGLTAEKVEELLTEDDDPDGNATGAEQ